MATSVSFRSCDSDMGERRLEQIVGSSPALEAALREVERVAPTDSTVLVLGKTGTGGMIGGPQGAPARLGLKRTTLLSKMKSLGIFRPLQRSMSEFDVGSELTI